VGEHAYTSVQLSHYPDITPYDFRTSLVVNPLGSHMHFVPQHPYSYSDDPLDCTAFCSSVPDSTLVVNEDQSIDGVGVAQPTYAVIHEEYDWELEHHHSTKDGFLLSEPPLFFPDIYGEPAIHDFTCVSPSTDAPIVDHL